MPRRSGGATFSGWRRQAEAVLVNFVGLGEKNSPGHAHAARRAAPGALETGQDARELASVARR